MWIEEWCQGQGFLLPWSPSEKAQRGSRWAKVLAVLVRTSEGYKWVAEKWWETITMIAPVKENLNLLLRLTRVEANVDS